MIQKEKKTQVILENATHEGDTGSPEVQIAILTARINELTEHLRVHKHDVRVDKPASTTDASTLPEIPHDSTFLTNFISSATIK